jgi:hypothetical protein
MLHCCSTHFRYKVKIHFRIKELDNVKNCCDIVATQLDAFKFTFFEN